MKRFLKGIVALSLGLAVAGCAKEYDDTALKSKVDNLTTEVNTLKAQQQAMQAVIDVWKAGGYVQSIDNSVPGQHTITFYGENGKTVVIYDGTQGPQGEAGEAGDSFFASIVTDENGVTFTLNDKAGTSFTIPFAKAFKLVIKNLNAEVEAGVAVEFPYDVENANATTTVDVFAGGNYVAEVNAVDKKIVVTPPTPVTNGSVLVWAQNEEGLFSMKKLTFLAKADTEVATKQEELEAIPGEAGDFVVKVVSNVDIAVEEPTVDWVTVAVTKADYKLTLTLTENTTGEPRETEIVIVRKDNGAQVQKVKIVQLALDNAPMPDAKPGDVLWSEDWTVEQDGIMLADYAFTGTKVFMDYKVKYSAVKPANGSDIKVYLDNQMGGEVQGNLLLSKNGGTWTITDIPSGNAAKIALTFKSNANNRIEGVTSTTEGVTMGDMVAPTEKSKPYTYAYDITLAPGVTKFNLTFTCNSSSNARLDDIVLMVPEVAKELTIKTVFAKNSTETESWNSYFGGTAGSDRNIAMDDDYVYIAESSATAKLWAISVADPNQVKQVNVEGVSGGGAHVLSCPRVIKNTDANVNGGKDVLICSSLTRGEEDPKLYMWVNGIDNAPKAITLTTWATANWYGDTFTVWGTLQDGVLLFDKTDSAGNGVVTFILNGVPAGNAMYLIGRIKTVEAFGSHSGVCAFYPVPDGTAGVYSPGRGTEARGQFGTLGSSLKTEGGIAVTLTPLDYDEGTNGFVLGYNFVEWEGNRYVIYGNYKDNKTGYVRVRQGALTDAWSKVASTGTRLYRRDLVSGGLTAGNSGMDITARVINGELYIAAQMQNVGFGLYKLCYE